MGYPHPEKPRVEVCFSPNLFPLHKNEHEIVVVIDVLRATTAICTAFQYGVESIIPLATIEEARAYLDKGYMVAAERKGQVVEGFTMGNSPYSYMTEEIRGKSIALTTTNGTKAIKTVDEEVDTVVIGALVNLDAVCRYLKDKQANVLLLCAGWENRFNLEDTVCAGAIADQLLHEGDFRSEHDSTIAAKYLSRSARDNYFGFLRSSSHRRRLRDLDLNEDIKFCLTPGQADVVPVLKDGVLVDSGKIPEIV